MKKKLCLLFTLLIFCHFHLQVNSSRNEFIGDCLYYDTSAGVTDAITFICNDHIRSISYFNTTSFKCSNASVTIINRVAGTMHFRNCQLSRIKYNIMGSFPYVHTLNISHIELKFLPNDFFKGSTKLKNLIASNNKLTQLSRSQFFFAPNFTRIDLSFNSINKINDEALTECQLTEQIDLSHNKLTTIETNVFKRCLKLQILDLSFNVIEKIAAESFGKLTGLERLNLSHNNLSSIKSESFGELKKLTHLDLSYNFIKILKSEMIHNFDENLETLYLNGNNLIDLNGFDEIIFGHLNLWSFTENQFNCSYLQQFFNLFQSNIHGIDAKLAYNQININGISCAMDKQNTISNGNSLNGNFLLLMLFVVIGILLITIIFLIFRLHKIANLNHNNQLTESGCDTVHFLNKN